MFSSYYSRRDTVRATKINSQQEVLTTQEEELVEVYEIVSDSDSNINILEDFSVEPQIQHQHFKVFGRRIVEMDYFLSQLKVLDEHSPVFGCSFKNLVLVREVNHGFCSELFFECNMCNAKLSANTCEKIQNESLNVNSAAVLGITNIGCGQSHLEEMSAILDIPGLSTEKFMVVEKQLGEMWQKTSEANMQKAAQEEVNAAILRGDVDKVDGIA